MTKKLLTIFLSSFVLGSVAQANCQLQLKLDVKFNKTATLSKRSQPGLPWLSVATFSSTATMGAVKSCRDAIEYLSDEGAAAVQGCDLITNECDREIVQQKMEAYHNQ